MEFPGPHFAAASFFPVEGGRSPPSSLDKPLHFSYLESEHQQRHTTRFMHAASLFQEAQHKRAAPIWEQPSWLLKEGCY